MMERESGPSSGEWDNIAGRGGDGDGDQAAGAAGLGSPPARIGDARHKEALDSMGQPLPSDPALDRGSRGGIGAGLGGSRDAGAGAEGA